VSYTPRIGDYGVVRTSGVFGKLIRLGTSSPDNHAVIYIGNGLLVEATPHGVKINSIDEYPLIAWNQHEELTDTQREAIAAHARSLVGKPYSFITIALIVLRILGAKFLSDNKFMVWAATKEGYICSELVAECYSSAGIKLFQKPDYEVVPGDLSRRLELM